MLSSTSRVHDASRTSAVDAEGEVAGYLELAVSCGATLWLFLDLIHPTADRGEISGVGSWHGSVAARRFLTSVTDTPSGRPVPTDHETAG